MVEVQRLAAGIIAGVLSGRSLDTELPGAWRTHAGLAAHSRAVIQDIAYGTLRHLGRLEAMLDALLDKPLKDARLRPLLLVALYQLDGTRAAPHAVVDHAVRACHAIGLSSARGLANAVLRNFVRRRPALQARVERAETARYSHPQWWIDKLRSQYPDRYTGVLESANERPPRVLRVNRLRLSAFEYRALLTAQGLGGEIRGEAAVALDKPVPADRIPGLSQGLVSVHDAAALPAAPALYQSPRQPVLVESARAD